MSEACCRIIWYTAPSALCCALTSSAPPVNNRPASPRVALPAPLAPAAGKHPARRSPCCVAQIGTRGPRVGSEIVLMPLAHAPQERRGAGNPDAPADIAHQVVNARRITHLLLAQPAHGQR